MNVDEFTCLSGIPVHLNGKTYFSFSSQLSPPCERGLMALCALGLVNSDVTLAGAALGELMKLPVQGELSIIFRTMHSYPAHPATSYSVEFIFASSHRSRSCFSSLFFSFFSIGNKELTAEVCYFYSRFYALQVKATGNEAEVHSVSSTGFPSFSLILLNACVLLFNFVGKSEDWTQPHCQGNP